MKLTALRWVLAGSAFVSATLSGLAGAQNAPILQGLSDQEIQILAAPIDPTVRKATAIVNGDVITDTDIDQRLNLVLAANRTRIDDAEKARIRLQVLRNLIDEKLQIQEAADHEVTISSSEIQRAYTQVAGNFKMKPPQFADYLRTQGTSDSSMKQQIHAELAWSRLLRRRVEPFVNVGDDEVQGLIDRLNASKGKTEYRISEIFLAATPEIMPQALETAGRIVEQIRRGASFVAYARQFSEASSAAVGGDLGWVRAAQLSEQLQPVVESLPEGQISNPIQVPGGVVIVGVVDARQVLMVNPDDAILSVKQLTIPLGADASRSQAQALVRRIQSEVQSMGGCGGAEGAAQRLGGTVVSNDQVRLGSLPGQLKEIMDTMQIGQSTPPFGAPGDGLRALVLCGREDPKVNAPSFERLYAQLEENRVSMMARRYLRDLRRDAIVDYR